MRDSARVGRREFLGACSAAIMTAGLGSTLSNAEAGRDDLPNIVLFLVDDMGWQDTSVPFWDEPTPFNRHYRTPHMERLARQGIRFLHARAHPVCSPTRTSIMTGWNPARHHVTNWTLYADEDTSKAEGPLAAPRAWRMQGLQAPAITLPSLLRQAGYYTIHCGKAHWGAVDTPGEDPRQLGFDVNIAGHAAGAPGSYQGEDYFGNKVKGSYSRPWGVPGLEEYHGQEVHLTDVLTEKAEEALRAAADRGKPIYLYMAHYAVHTPIQPHKRFMPHYSERNYPGTEIDIPAVEEQYAAMLEGIDASLGKLLESLDVLGIAETTLVLFASDNGGLSAHARGMTPRGTGLNTHNWPCKAGKGSAYEGGTRVPFIVSWARPNPDNPCQRRLPIPAGVASVQPVISEDVFETVLGVASAEGFIPAGYPRDGRDMRAWLLQKSLEPERALHFHYPHVWGPHGPGYEPHSALIVGSWKAIYFYAARRWELYNIEADPGEEEDRASEEVERLQRMAEQFLEDLNAMGAQWPVRRDTGAEEPLYTPKELRNMAPAHAQWQAAGAAGGSQ